MFRLILFFQDYEFQILTYKALQEPIASPLKKPKMECESDNIIQEVRASSLRLRTRMNVLLFSMTH